MENIKETEENRCNDKTIIIKYNQTIVEEEKSGIANLS